MRFFFIIAALLAATPAWADFPPGFDRYGWSAPSGSTNVPQAEQARSSYSVPMRGESDLMRQLGCGGLQEGIQSSNACERMVSVVYCEYYKNLPEDAQQFLAQQFECRGDEDSYRACMQNVRKQYAFMLEPQGAHAEMIYLLTHFRDNHRDTVRKVCNAG